jgi:hypothetical protein
LQRQRFFNYFQSDIFSCFDYKFARN